MAKSKPPAPGSLQEVMERLRKELERANQVLEVHAGPPVSGVLARVAR
jgi:hypothetical protein